MDYTFGNKIHWEIAPQSWEIDTLAAALEKDIRSSCDVPDNESSRLVEFTILYVSTKSIKLDLNTAKDALHLFFADWNSRRELSPAQLWQWRKRIPYKLWDAWVAAWQDEQPLFEVPPEQLPTSALTDEQRVEAAQPNSPLPLNGKRSPEKLST